MKTNIRKALFVLVLAASALVAGCGANVGVGLNVGVPVGNHGYMSFGSNHWF
jgi:predicted small secreted protein